MKELKHKKTCEVTRRESRDSIIFIVSTDGCLGEAAEIFFSRLGRKLALKWQRAYSQEVAFLNAPLSAAILRVSSHCLRGARTRMQGTECLIEDGAALGVATLEGKDTKKCQTLELE